MPPASSGHPDSAVEIDPVTPAPLPRVPADPLGVPAGPAARSSLAQARIRESSVRNAAAAELFEDGRVDEAVTLFEQALATCRITLGGEHPDTLVVAGNLGVAYVASGNRRKGIKLIRNNLASRERVLGEDHPATLTARNALAVAHRTAGDADTAVGLAKQVAVQRSRVLGPTHVDTLTSRMGLALALAAAGAMSSAHRILSSTMSDAEEVLGPDHDHTMALVECGETSGLIRREV